MATKEQKRKKTHVVRYYGEEDTDSENFWVDVETLDRITFNGRQGNISNKNQAQETTVNLADFAKDPGRKLFTVRVRNPQDDNQYIDIDFNGTIEVNTRSKFQYQKTGRWFDSGGDNQSRKFLPLRIINNNIDDQYLTEVTDNKTGRKTKQPPSDSNSYLEAVRKTNDKDESQFLSVQLIDTFGISRAKNFQHQAVQFNGMWNNTLLYKPEGEGDVMPGVEESPGGVPAVMLDPLQVIVNFGGGGLAVEFGDKAENAPGDGKKKQ